MGEKGGGHATTAEERDERHRFAVARLCTSTDDVDSVTAICHKFNVNRVTANKYLRAGKKLIGAGLPAEIDGWRTLVRTTLLFLLNKKGEDSASVRATLKQMADLLGLAAPTRTELVVTEHPRDTLAEFAARPDLLERQLKLEEELEDARSNPFPEQPGPDSVPAVDVPGPLAGTPAARDEAVDGPELQ